MNLFVLIELHANHNHVGWSVSYSLEDTLAGLCKVNFLYPIQNKGLTYFQPKDPDLPDLITRIRQTISKSWFDLETLPTLADGPNVLLVIGLKPRFLLSIFALKH